MKTSKILIALGIFTLGVASLPFLSDTWAVENVRNTKHNLSLSTNAINQTNTTEVCVFCHTPHGSNTSGASERPLWNRALPATTGYQMYSSNYIDGTIASTPQGISLACLSCHDGTVAFDQLFNLPGSGGGNGGLATGTITFANVANKVLDEKFDPAYIVNLSQDLRNDHPISIKICGGDTAVDPQFKDACASHATPAGNIKKLGKVSTLLTSDARDSVRAYKNGADWYVECASCHNPHEDSSRFFRYQSAVATPDPAIAYPAVLDQGPTVDRNKGSLLCLSCHEK